MADEKKKVNTIKSIGKKVANNGNADDYVYTPIGADSENVDRPDGSNVEDSLIEIETEKVEIIPVESLPESEIKIYPYVYALIKPNESIGTLYEYRNERWIKYGNGSDGIWVGTKEQCVQDFDNIEKGTIVIIVNKKEDSGETHTHDYVCQITKEPTYSEKGSKTYTCFLCGESYTEEIPALIDSIKPAGVIRIGENEYSSWKDNISFNTYYKNNQTVTIEATDNETGVKEIAYHLANTSISDSSIGSITWTTYTDPFIIQPNDNYIVYVKITDNADNVTYICSDGIVMDNIPPVFEGLEDGGTYPTGTVLTVEDGAVLTVNGEVVELTNGSYTFSEPMDNCRLSVTDQAGNINNISINIVHVHNYTQEITKTATCTEDGIITYSCACGDIYTEPIPASGDHNFVDNICSICGKNEYEDFELTESNYNQVGLSSLDGNIVVPSLFEYSGQKYKISTINIKGSNNLLTITLPDTVYDIKYIKSESLKEINMTNNVKNIGYIRCPALNHIILSSGLTEISNMCFAGCTSLLSIGGIGSGASLEIPNSIKRINDYSFRGCTGLSIVDLPEGIEEILYDIFKECNNLKTLTVPSTYKKCESSGFGTTNSVTKLYYNSEYYKFGSDISGICYEGGYDLYFGEYVNNLPKFLQLTKVKNIEFASKNISTIPFALLNGQNLLKNVQIPESVTTIERSAFKNCTNLSNLIIPSSVVQIDPEAFLNVPHITYHGTASGAPWGALSMN